MVLLSFIGTIFLLFVLPAEVYSAGYILSLYDNVDEDFRFVKEKSTFQDMEPVKVFLYKYEHIHSKQCMQVVSFNIMETEDNIDFFMVSCDVKPPFTKQDSLINVANLGYLSIQKDFPLWAVYVLPTGKCVQRLYTNKEWTFLDDIEEMDLTMQQCQRVISHARPLKSSGSKVDLPTEKKLMPIGQTKARVITLDDTHAEHLKRDESKHEDREAQGQIAKLTVYPLKDDETGECARFVSINNIQTEDFLDFLVITCDGQENDELVIEHDLIGFAGLVYVRDHEEDPIWAIFVMKDEEDKHCVLRVYTDMEHKLLHPKNHIKLNWDDCSHIVEKKDMNEYKELILEAFLNYEDKHPPLITVSRTYEEVVQMLQKDMSSVSPSDNSNEVDPKYVKPEGPEYQAVPQPAPPASVIKQEFEEDVKAQPKTVKAKPQTSSSPPTSPSPQSGAFSFVNSRNALNTARSASNSFGLVMKPSSSAS